MNITEIRAIVKLAWRNLQRNPRRTVGSVVTVCLGSAALLIFQGFNTGITSQYREDVIHGYYGYGQVFTKNYYSQVYEKPWEHWFDNPSDIEAQLKSIPEVLEVFPRVSFFSFIVKGGINLSGKGEGIMPEKENIFFDKMVFLEGGPLQTKNDIIIGEGLAKSLAAKPGSTVTLLTQTLKGQINGVDLTVAGVFQSGVKEIDDHFFRVHLDAAQELLDTKKIELFSLNLKESPGYFDSLEKQIAAKFPNLEAIRFEVLDKVYYQNSVNFLEAQFSFFRVIILFIVALGIFNTIAVGLLERAGEIGALRANGEKRRRLFKILLIESGFIGLIGGATGIILSVLLMKTVLAGGIPMPAGPGVTRDFLVLLVIKFPHYVQSLLLPMITTMLASVLPIRKLLRRSIPDLLRST